MSVFPAIRIEGGLLGPDTLDLLLAGELPGQQPRDFGLESRRSLTDEIASVFADARTQWEIFQHRLERLPETDPATSLTRDAWMIPFLSLLGYEPRYNPRAYEVDGASFAISHRAGQREESPPVHIVGARQELGRVGSAGRPRLAPHSLVQEFLNRTEHLWGIATNGKTVRLLRDSTYIRRQAYVEFDLEQILAEQRFTDFAVLYRLLHRSRLPRSVADARDCLLERYYQHALEQGGRVRDRLRDGVEACLRQLANGFLAHPGNAELRRRVIAGADQPGHLSPQELYRQLLRLVYRFLFLLVSEDRGLISAHPLYREHYGVARLRRLLDRRSAYTDHDDLWLGLRVLWTVLTKEQFAALLEVAPLNGELFEPLELDDCTITNRDLLEAFWHLAYYRESPSSPPRRVNYAALDVEELGSVYESLLEFQPCVDLTAQPPRFNLVQEGGERRSTGSHYTPPELVAPLVQHALEPVLADRLARAATRAQKERAILSLKVCDLACGSGHFLLAAARHLGKALARIRTGEDEPSPERVREAIRDVITHCLYGVDKNPLAVELCRVALWLEAHTGDKPLTFLDHRIRCGDSLVGVFDLNTLRAGIPDDAFKPLAGDDKTAARAAKARNAAERAEALFQFAFADKLQHFARELQRLDTLPEDTIEQVRAKADACRRLEQSADFAKLKLACDLWTAAFFQPFVVQASAGPQQPDRLKAGLQTPITTDALRTALATGSLPDKQLAGWITLTALQHRYFHWPLAFPEVLAAGGFDVFLGNPPFMGGKRISTVFGVRYRAWLEKAFDPFTNTADLCAAFFRRAFALLKPGGRMGLIATNTLGQGDTRESGLAVLLRQGGVIPFARRFVKWPGQANVEVNLVTLARPPLAPAGRVQPLLDDRPVDAISSRLDDEPEAEPSR